MIPIALSLSTAQTHARTAAASPRPALTAAAQGAADVVASFHRSLKSGDTASASDLLADDALIYESGSVERSKAEYAGHHLPADTAFAKATTRTVLRMSGEAVGNLAWIATEARTTSTYKGRAIDNSSTETMMLRRSDGRWRIVHIHWSSGK